MDVAARLEVVEKENAVLRERVLQLESQLGHDWLPPIEWCLTPAEARVFGVLLARDLATKDACMAALYRDLGREEAEVKIVDVYICKMRRKLKAFGILIGTRWGEGYFLTAETKAAIA